MKKNLRKIKRLITAVIGFTLLFIGLILIFIPGPALIIIPLALSVLASEFIWAQKLSEKFRDKFGKRKRSDNIEK
ncbi:MAG: hypothetical protein Kow0098_01140 [Ignavibacteriaceae bacterium]